MLIPKIKKRPSKKTVVILSILWLIGNGLIILVATDLFRQGMEIGNSLKSMMGLSTLALIGFWVAYQRPIKEAD